jgi:serine/threonine protein kinase
MPSTVDVDRGLLFAVLALQDDIIDQTQLADLCAGWAVRLDRPLPDLLLDRGWITPQDRQDLERKLERKLKKYQGDPHRTLGAVAEVEARDILHSIASPAVRATINNLAPPRGHVLLETLMPSPSDRETQRYTITRLHAEGGLGKVWIAHDTDLNRQVALKEIKASTTLSTESSRRFLQEAQITGQLEHPNIVPVYELTRRKQDNQPFYTMRFVRGQNLRDAIEEFHRRRAGKPAERLDLQRCLLEPFIKICEAVGYAHSRGVIHRDLKPDNVILGGHGEVLVLDWGLAKILGQSETEAPKSIEPHVSLSSEVDIVVTEGQLGTPAYMAPEQVEARNDLMNTRTDIYGLGAILFEILTGKPPATGPTLGEIFRKIQSRSLPRAREVEPTVSHRLEAVCAKALAYDRADRYRRAEDLADDIRRWLVDEPVSVYKDSLPVRLVRWARKHRTLVTSLAALLLTAVCALSVGVVLINKERGRTENQRQIAEVQKGRALANAEQALQNLRLAQGAADGLLAEVADVDLADIPQMESVRKRLLEKAMAGYRDFVTQKGNDPLIRWGSGRSQVRLGDIQALLGDFKAAEAAYRQALEGLDELAKNDPENRDFLRDLARAHHGLGVLLKDAVRYPEANDHLLNATSLRQRLAAQPGASAEDRVAWTDSQYQYAALLARSGPGRPEDAEAYKAAIDVQQELVRAYNDRPEYRGRLARSRNNLALLQQATGQADAAEATLRSTLEFLAPLTTGATALPASKWQLARAANNLATLLLKRNPDEATRQLETARDMLGMLKGEFPAIPQYTQELASVQSNLGHLAQNAGRGDEAKASYQEVIALLESLKNRTPALRLKLALANVDLNEILANTSPVEAEAALRKALGEETELQAQYPNVPDYKQNLGRGHYQLARLLYRLKRFPAAAEEDQTARDLHQQVLATGSGSEAVRGLLLEDQGFLTLSLIAAGRLADAASVCDQIATTHPTDRKAHLRGAAYLVKCGDSARAATKSDPKLPDRSDDYFSRAVKFLRNAYQIAPYPAKDLDREEFQSLQGREDFENLRRALSQPPSSG